MKVVKLKEKDIERLVKNILKESHTEGIDNYMFFQNLREIKENIETLLSMDINEVDYSLSNGHDWASEHMATAKDDIEEVTSFLKNRHSSSVLENVIKESEDGKNCAKSNKGCVSKRYLVKFVDSFWFEHETTVDAECEFDAIEQVQEQFKNASHFSVSEL